MAVAMRSTVASMLKGIDRYNPDNLVTLEKYVEIQARENTYDLEANLAILKLYQFNPTYYQQPITLLILLKALTNLPHTDFILCKCLIDQINLEAKIVQQVMCLAELLELCQFKKFWMHIQSSPELVAGITGFEDSIRKFVCHVVNITYQTIDKAVLIELLGDITDPQLRQWVTKYGWQELPNGLIFIANQEENIKTKNIMEKIEFDSVAGIMSICR